MIKVVGVWEQGWNAPLSEFPLWDFPLRSFDVDEFCMTPVSGIAARVTEAATIEDVIAANPGLVPVYIDENGAEDLATFDHPEDALYILGKAGYSPWKAHGEKGRSLRIETSVGGGMMWPHQCVTMALHDRMVKS